MSDDNLSNNMPSQEDQGNYEQKGNNSEKIKEDDQKNDDNDVNDENIKMNDCEKCSNNDKFSPSPKRETSIARSNTSKQTIEKDEQNEIDKIKDNENDYKDIDVCKDDNDVYNMDKVSNDHKDIDEHKEDPDVYNMEKLSNSSEKQHPKKSPSIGHESQKSSSEKQHPKKSPSIGHESQKSSSGGKGDNIEQTNEKQIQNKSPSTDNESKKSSLAGKEHQNPTNNDEEHETQSKEMNKKKLSDNNDGVPESNNYGNQSPSVDGNQSPGADKQNNKSPNDDKNNINSESSEQSFNNEKINNKTIKNDDKQPQNDQAKKSNFKKFQIGDELFKQFDQVLVKLSSLKYDAVGQILGLKPQQSEQGNSAKVEIKWFIRQHELVSNKQRELISTKEVFESDDTAWIDATTINGKCIILSYKEYKKKSTDGSIPENEWAATFFSRSKILSNDKENGIMFDPPINTWKSQCICKSPLNFDIDMLNCDKCQKWFQTKCIGIKAADLKLQDNKEWICNDCGGNNKQNYDRKRITDYVYRRGNEESGSSQDARSKKRGRPPKNYERNEYSPKANIYDKNKNNDHYNRGNSEEAYQKRKRSESRESNSQYESEHHKKRNHHHKHKKSNRKRHHESRKDDYSQHKQMKEKSPSVDRTMHTSSNKNIDEHNENSIKNKKYEQDKSEEISNIHGNIKSNKVESIIGSHNNTNNNKMLIVSWKTDIHGKKPLPSCYFLDDLKKDFPELVYNQLENKVFTNI